MSDRYNQSEGVVVVVVVVVVVTKQRRRSLAGYKPGISPVYVLLYPYQT